MQKKNLFKTISDSGDGFEVGSEAHPSLRRRPKESDTSRGERGRSERVLPDERAWRARPLFPRAGDVGQLERAGKELGTRHHTSCNLKE